MKKILIAIILSIIILPGCSITDAIKNLGDDISNSYEKATKETKETIDTVNETKAKIEETVEDLQNAKKEIGEAAAAVSEIVK